MGWLLGLPVAELGGCRRVACKRKRRFGVLFGLNRREGHYGTFIVLLTGLTNKGDQSYFRDYIL